jgi:putative phosphoribosyl transferase
MLSHAPPNTQTADRPPVRRRNATIEVSPDLTLGGDLVVPQDCDLIGAIAFPRICRRARDRSAYDRRAISSLCGAGLATLSFDVLSAHEKLSADVPTDGETIADRLAAATRFLREQPETARVTLGYLATGAGSAAALLAAARLQEAIRAVVSVGAPPGAARPYLQKISAPVLLIIGGGSEELDAACAIRQRLAGSSELVMIPGASSMTMGDPRPRRRAMALAARWFVDHLGDARTA